MHPANYTFSYRCNEKILKIQLYFYEDNHIRVTMVNVALNAIFTNTLVYFTIRTPFVMI